MSVVNRGMMKGVDGVGGGGWNIFKDAEVRAVIGPERILRNIGYDDEEICI